MILEDVLSRLYDSEIHVTIQALWDGGWQAWLTYLEAAVQSEPVVSVDHILRMPNALHLAALEQYPTSQYARLYRNLLSEHEVQHIRGY